MEKDNIMNYLLTKTKKYNKTYYLKQVFSIGILSFFVMFPGVMLGSPWKYVAFSILLLAIITIVFVIIYTRFFLTIKHKLILNIVVSVFSMAQFIEAQIILLAVLHIKQVWILFLLAVPCILIPVGIILLTKKTILKGGFSSKGSKIVTGFGIGGIGVIGYYLAKCFLSNMNQSVAVWFIILVFGLLSYIYSIDLVAVYDLYLLSLLKKLD